MKERTNKQKKERKTKTSEQMREKDRTNKQTNRKERMIQ